MQLSHEGRVAIITGAGQGIGREAALRFADRGATVVLVDQSPPTETASMLGGDVLCVVGDVSRSATWNEVAEAVMTRHGHADIVINNAGIYPFAGIDELTEELWHKTIAVNLTAHFHSAKAFVPIMRRRRWGRFVNVSSNSIASCYPGLSHYMASKMGVLGFVRGLANDVASDNITVNAIIPALTNTPGQAGTPTALIEEFVRLQAIKRFAEPADIVGPMLFLSSDDAAFVTGQALVADGGLYKIS